MTHQVYHDEMLHTYLQKFYSLYHKFIYDKLFTVGDNWHGEKKQNKNRFWLKISGISPGPNLNLF